MKKLTALITGFAPFAGRDFNPSQQAVDLLPEELDGCRICRHILPVSFSCAFAELEKAIAACDPDLVLCTGLAEKRSLLTLERVAINVADARIPDNDGRQPQDAVIDYTAPNAYFAALPLRRILADLQASGIEAAISDSAGTYVCNQVMFRLLHLIRTQRPNMQGGFIHVPLVVETFDLNENVKQMLVSQVASALRVVISSCIGSQRSGHWKGTQRRIFSYNPDWPEEFGEIARHLRDSLADKALRIDHIGSTSVPGLAAKDVIDIQITVGSLDAGVDLALASIGYTRAENVVADHIPPGYPHDPLQWQKWYFRPPSGQRPTNTHVRVAGRANQRLPLLFRDYLRSHPHAAEAYARLKMRLADNLANAAMYPDVKDPAVDLIFFLAENWALETGWSL